MKDITNFVVDRLISGLNFKLIDEYYSPIPGAELFVNMYSQKL